MDPGAFIHDMAASVRPDGPYRDPSENERINAKAAAERLLVGAMPIDRYGELFKQLGFELTFGSDPATGRPYVLLAAIKERSWGALLIDASVPPNLLVEVPHPGFDINTDVVGIELFRARPGVILLVAGAHRNAAAGLGDPAHNDKALFHTFATALAAGGLPELQLHGFADRNLPGSEVVVSTGSAEARALARTVGDRLIADGFQVCQAWEKRCGRLEGNTNVQGQAAAKAATVFIHLEMGYSVRSSDEARGRLVHALASVK